MPVAVRTHPINRGLTSRTFLLSFKRTTPRKILSEVRKKYETYLNDDEDLIPIAATPWYKKMSKEMTPAKYLKTCREIAGYSQARLGALAGVPASRISDYETGQRTISKEMAKKLAEVFETSPAEFI